MMSPKGAVCSAIVAGHNQSVTLSRLNRQPWQCELETIHLLRHFGISNNVLHLLKSIYHITPSRCSCLYKDLSRQFKKQTETLWTCASTHPKLSPTWAAPAAPSLLKDMQVGLFIFLVCQKQGQSSPNRKPGDACTSKAPCLWGIHHAQCGCVHYSATCLLSQLGNSGPSCWCHLFVYCLVFMVGHHLGYQLSDQARTQLQSWINYLWSSVANMHLQSTSDWLLLSIS